MNFILIEGKISLKVTRARCSIKSQKAKELVLHLWMYQQQSVGKKNNGSEESRKKQCYERATFKNEPGLFRLHRRILHCPTLVSP